MMPDRLLLKNSAVWRTMPLVMLIPLTLSLVVGVGLYLNGTPIEELTLPIVAMSVFSLAIGLLFAILALISTFMERGSIGRVFREPWAAFVQFPNDAAWRAYAEREREEGLKASGMPWASLIVVIVIFGFVSGFSIFYVKAPVELYYGIGAMLAVVLVIVFGGVLKSRAAVGAAYRRRLESPLPLFTIARWGVYDEDKGFDTLRGLQRVRYLEPGETPGDYLSDFALQAGAPEATGRSGWGALVFTVRWYRRMIAHTSVIVVRVPPSQVAEARALVDRFYRENF